jgi:hypothetical protein
VSVLELFAGGGGLVLAAMTVIQITPVKLDPWSWLAKAIGKAINADVLAKLGEVEKRLDKHITVDDQRAADGNRTRILHFNNELVRNLKHTKEEFVEILAEIDAYEEYCRSHPEYPNNRAVIAIDNVRDVYKERLKKNDFL